MACSLVRSPTTEYLQRSALEVLETSWDEGDGEAPWAPHHPSAVPVVAKAHFVTQMPPMPQMPRMPRAAAVNELGVLVEVAKVA